MVVVETMDSSMYHFGLLGTVIMVVGVSIGLDVVIFVFVLIKRLDLWWWGLGRAAML